MQGVTFKIGANAGKASGAILGGLGWYEGVEVKRRIIADLDSFNLVGFEFL